MTLNLNNIVNVSVSLSGLPAARNGFDTGLIIGNSGVIGTKERVRMYTDADTMLDDGFLAASPEYKAALIYFAQTPKPAKVMIGRHVASNVTESAEAVAAGTGVTAATVTAATFGQKVNNANGKYTFAYDGTDWLLGGAKATLSAYGVTPTGDAAEGDTITVTYCAAETAETYLAALTACREKSSAWYIAYLIGAEKADIVSAAGWAEAQTGVVLFYDTADGDTLSGASGNIFETLKGLGYERSLGVYAESGSYKAVAVMGYALAANDGTANSAYTLAYKALKGCSPTTGVSAAQVAALKGNNGNVYLQRAETYDVFEQGVMASGEHFDVRIGIDQLAYNIQRSVVDLLARTATKVPQTDAGMTQIKTAIAAECDKAVQTGFLASGVWNGPEVLNLKTGDALGAGYLIQSGSIDEQTAAERASRKAPPFYVALKLAGAIESVVVKLIVDR